MVAMSKQTSSTSCVGVVGAVEVREANESTEDVEFDFDGGRWEWVVTDTVETPAAGTTGAYMLE